MDSRHSWNLCTTDGLMDPIDRVRAALVAVGLGDVVLELGDSARTAQLAADATGT